MPKDTFLNLPQEKRSLIEAAALDEFAEYGYDNASINRIVAATGIAKGSFYQYFEDKADLYKHIMTRIAERKMDYVTPVMMNPTEHDFFTLLEALYRSGLAFGKDNPKMGQIGFEVYKNQANPVFKEIYEESKAAGYAFYNVMLDLAVERGEVDPTLDRAFTIHMLIYLQVASFDYYFDTVKAGEINPTVFEDDIMPTVNLMLNFIKNGIQQKEE